MTNRFNMYRTASLALVAGLMVLAPGLASAQPRCAALSGSYAMAFSGTFTIPGNTAPMPFNGVAVVTFAAGKFAGTESANFNGSIVRSAPISGTYTINPDCTGTTTVIFPNGNTGLADFVVANEGKTIYAIGVVDNLGPGNMTSLTYTKI